MTQSKQQKKNKFLKKDNLRDLWDNIKHTNIHIIEVPKEDERKG